MSAPLRPWPPADAGYSRPAAPPRWAAEVGPLPRFLLLYALVYAAYGIEGPFLPALLAERGLSAEMIGLVLAAGTGARLLSAPFAASLADRFGAPRAALGGALVLSALLGCGFALASGFAGMLLVSILVAVALAPVNPLADALASTEAARAPAEARRGRGGFSYGLVRGAGSAAFVGAAMVAGPVVVGAGLEMAIWANAGLLLLGAVAVMALPRRGGAPGGGGNRPSSAPRAAPEPGALRQLLAMPVFRRLLLVTGLVQGSHALYGAFATLHWQAEGIPLETIGVLWSVAVAAEVGVFLLGPRLLGRFGPAGLAAVAAAAGVLRWGAMAATSDVVVQFLLQPLHGLTFAALHLATMRLLAETVPPRLSATAFGVQASLGPGLAGALLTLAAGPLYGALGAGAFWAMAALCAVALPAALTLAAREEETGAPAEVPAAVEAAVTAPVPALAAQTAVLHPAPTAAVP